MTVYSYYVYGDARSLDGMTISISHAERVVLEGRPFIRQYGDYLSSEQPGKWFATEAEARNAAAAELLLMGHRLIAQAKKESVA